MATIESTDTQTAKSAAPFMTEQGLAYAFWGSFTDEQQFLGSPETEVYAREIIARGDQMWNWPSAVTDAEIYLS